MISYKINGKQINFKTHQFEGKLSINNYENQIYSALSKIGVDKNFVEINYSSDLEKSFAQVTWEINKKNFIFRCSSQENTFQNLGAIAQAIQEDVRQVTRGIKDLFKIMNQYKTENIIRIKKSGLLNFSDSNSNSNSFVSSDDLFPFSENKIDSISNEVLDSNYYYLQNYENEKLDLIYYKLKQQCIVQNKADHPLFIALKIIRKKRGLDL